MKIFALNESFVAFQAAHIRLQLLPSQISTTQQRKMNKLKKKRNGSEIRG